MLPPKFTSKRKVEKAEDAVYPLMKWADYLNEIVRNDRKMTVQDVRAFREMVHGVEDLVGRYGDSQYHRGERETIPLFGSNDVSPVKAEPRIVYASAHGKGQGSGDES